MKSGFLAFWLSGLAATSASAQQQFDLVCAGELTALSPGSQSASPYRRVLRVDLKANQWCADACLRVDQIARVEPGRLVLVDEKRDTPREYWTERESVNRVSGEHSGMASNNPNGPNPRSTFRKGQCEPAPFSGFLTGPTKF